MKRLRIVVSLPTDNAYLHEQKVVAKSTARRLGLDPQVVQAADDPTTQSQQLIQIVESSSEVRPDAFLVDGTFIGVVVTVMSAGVRQRISPTHYSFTPPESLDRRGLMTGST